MRTRVVTDSSAADPAIPGVGVVPIWLLFARGEIADGPAAAREVVGALARGEPVKTRAPSVTEYLDAIEQDDADGVVVVTPARELTAMWRNASHAMYLADRPCAVVDSRTASAGQVLVVEAAWRAASAGGTLADVVAAAEDAARRVRLVATVGTVEPIASSGFVAASSAGRLHAGHGRPLFRLLDGAVEVVRRMRDDGDVVRALVDLWRREGGCAGQPTWAFGTAVARGRELAKALGGARFHRPSTALAVYTGVDVLGIAWLSATARPAV